MKRFRVAMVIAIGLLAAHLLEPVVAAQPRSCDGLSSLKLATATVTVAESVAAGGFAGRVAAPPGAPDAAVAFDKLPPFCRVAATLKPSPDSDIKIEVWMPASGWNGKFLGVGNGGWAGTISYAAMAAAVARGYATASTDTGHSSSGGAFVLGHPEKLVDFGYRAVSEMTVTAKRIIEAHYGTAVRKSYWNGCSTGGRQGLMEAQRFPDHYDGMIIGAAATPRPLLNGWQLSLAQAALTNPAAFVPVEKHAAIHRAVIEACDAVDGLKDGLISNPPKCRFDPSALVCRGEEDRPTCLTARQVETVKAVMAPLRDRSGSELFPGWEPGAELGWRALIGGPEPTPLAIDHYRYVVFKNPAWDWKTFNAQRDIAVALEDRTVDVPEPDIAAFVKRGGKIVMYHGWSDPLVPPRASVNKFVRVQQMLDGADAAAKSVRLFMVPGMGHCGGGDGPNSFDTIGALEQWVENGNAPAQIVASHRTNGRVDRTRPLCPYPQVAQYKGAGNPDEAANFVCRIP